MVVSGLALWSELLVCTHTIITQLAALADQSDPGSTGDPFLDWIILGRGGQLIAALTAVLMALAGYLKIRTVAQKIPQMQDQISTVQEQTNGNVSYRDNRIATLENELRLHGVPIPSNQPREDNPNAGNS